MNAYKLLFRHTDSYKELNMMNETKNVGRAKNIKIKGQNDWDPWDMETEASQI